ncbi:MAG: DegT/DnrJ/EryC1/StrS family aminotransferase [Anaerolineae bacterium]|nr:DegT/DnrJ/EryC1/StrS family aminotransferase [Anaerolineae bacterium]
MRRLALNGGTPVRSAPFPERPIFDQLELTALEEVLTSRRWTSAPYIFKGDMSLSRTYRLERDYAAYHDCRFGIATGSGTDALQIAYAAAGLGPGDEAIMPPNTFIATATPALHLGAVPIFADVDPETLCLDPDAVEAAITDRTRLIVPLHLGGYPADMDRIMEIARRHDLTVVADACHAAGTEWRGRKVAAFSDLSAFSFQQDKQITAGEGGMVTTNDEKLYEQCYVLHNDGRGLGEHGGHFVAQGWNFRMSEFQAALLLAQLSRLDDLLKRKNRNARRLGAGLAQVGGLSWPREDERITAQSYVYPRLRYHAEAFDGLSAATFAEALRAEGIPCGAGSGWTLYRHPLFTESSFRFDTSRRVDYRQVHCPNAEDAAGRWIGFPQEVMLADERAIDDFVEAVAKIKANLGELAAAPA